MLKFMSDFALGGVAGGVGELRIFQSLLFERYVRFNMCSMNFEFIEKVKDAGVCCSSDMFVYM